MNWTPLLKKERKEASLVVVQWLRICLEVQGTCVLSLVGELKCHMPPKHLNQDLVQPNKIIKLMFKKKGIEFF